MNFRNIMQNEEQWKLELLAEALNATNPVGKWSVVGGWLRYDAPNRITIEYAESLRTLANGAWAMLERTINMLGVGVFDQSNPSDDNQETT
jgi:hypothetical protein